MVSIIFDKFVVITQLEGLSSDIFTFEFSSQIIFFLSGLKPNSNNIFGGNLG